MALSRTPDIMQGRPGTGVGRSGRGRDRSKSIPRFRDRASAQAWKRKYRPDLIAAEKPPPPMRIRAIDVPKLLSGKRVILSEEPEETTPWLQRETWGIKNQNLAIGGGVIAVATTAGIVYWQRTKKKKRRR